ncbi:MAG: universal stress protein [Arcobacter sp.]|nr:MAG: universal stress protein [Arcobacter sp.]
MNYKKMFFPIGGGEELEERLHGAMLVAKYFNVNLEFLLCLSNPNRKMLNTINLPLNIQDEISAVLEGQVQVEEEKFSKLFKKLAKDNDIEVSKLYYKNRASVYFTSKDGLRSDLVKQASKFCDLVIAAAPPLGVSTATFEAAVLNSGKPVIMIPRNMQIFDGNNIVIGWNNSPEASRAVTSAIPLLQKAKRVHIVSSLEYSKNDDNMNHLLSYLAYHDIDATFEIIKTTKVPGEALLNAALDGNFDLIIAGAYGHKGLRELMFGGATRYLLENSVLPVFMSH